MITKFITAFALVILLTYTTYLYSVIPWWGFAIGAFLTGIVVPQKEWLSWLSGFAGLFCCWAMLAWYMSSQNNHVMAIKMAQVLPLKGSSFMLVLITALVGAIIGGFASLSGAYLRKK